MEKHELIILIDKYLSGDATAVEERMLVNYYESYQKRDAWDEAVDGSQAQALCEVSDRLRMAMNTPASSIPLRGYSERLLKKAWIRYAAAVLLLAGLAVYYLPAITGRDEKTVKLPNTRGAHQTDVLPGGQRAVLTLADGTAILLDSAVNGSLAQQGGVQVVKMANGEIVYNMSGRVKEVLWNTMSTPIGGQYQIGLPDGTKVWLNAASSITYPTAFIDSTRHVKVTGEAYFEVVENKRQPFIVDVDGRASVRVLGTRFNINSYRDERSVKTTLIEGSVQVYSRRESVMIRPGQQAEISENAPLHINENVDVVQAVAWQRGMFLFTKMDLKSILRQITRWYNVEIDYRGGAVQRRTFSGGLSRKLPLSEVIKILEANGVHCELQGTKLIVE